eukprot:bmy_07987T0
MGAAAATKTTPAALGGPEGGRLRTSAGRSLRWEALAGAPPVLRCELGHKEPSALAPQDRGPEMEASPCPPMWYQTHSRGHQDPNSIKGVTKSAASSWDRGERKAFPRSSGPHWEAALQISIQTYLPTAYQPALSWSVQESTASLNPQGGGEISAAAHSLLFHKERACPRFMGPQKVIFLPHFWHQG